MNSNNNKSEEQIEDVSIVSKESWERDSEDENDEDGEGTTSTSSAAPIVRFWSECLRSLERPGLGIQLCSDKSRILSRNSRRSVLVLLELSKHYETYATILFQAAKLLLHPLIVTAAPSSSSSSGTGVDNDDKQDAASSSSILLLLSQLVRMRAHAYQQCAKKTRSSCILPLQNYLMSHRDATHHVQERYQASQERADKLRRRALQVQNGCTILHRETDEALRDWIREKAGGSEDAWGDNGNLLRNQQLPKQIHNQLLQIQKSDAKYRRFVKYENDCVRHNQRLEAMALETLQQLEGDRLLIFTHTLVKCLGEIGNKGAVEKEAVEPGAVSVLIPEQGGDGGSNNNSPTTIERQPKRRRSSSSFQKIVAVAEDRERFGAKEASELNLPAEIGELRDTVRSQIVNKAKTVQAAEIVSECLELVADASTKFANEVTQLIDRPESNNNLNSNCFVSVRDDMVSTEEVMRIQKLWDGLSRMLKVECVEARRFSEVCQTVKIANLNPILSFGAGVLKPASERDNATWKQLCDAARSRAAAEAVYLDVTAESAKVRDRCRSVDCEESNNAPWQANKQFSQSLANMFSILPNGGEHAMKVLDASTRASVVQISLEEADEKEAKVRQMLDSSSELTSLSLDAYKSSVEIVQKECSEKTDCQADFTALLNTLRSYFDESRLSFQKAFQCMDSLLEPSIAAGVPDALNSWSVRIERDMLAEEMSSSAARPLESMISVQLDPSDVVQKALSNMIDGGPVVDTVDMSESFDDETETEAQDETLAVSPSSPVRERTGSAASLLGFQRNMTEDSPAGWLLRSLTMPDIPESFIGKVTKKTSRVRQPIFGVVDTETLIFAESFWPHDVDPASIPKMIDSFACTFRDGQQRLPFQYGRVFISAKRLCFVGWTQKQISLKWSEVVAIEPAVNEIASCDDEVVVRCRRGSVEDSYMVLSGFFGRQKALQLMEETRQKVVSITGRSLNAQSPETLRGGAMATVPEDEILLKMQNVLSGSLRNISISEYYDLIWSETNSQGPFYKPWLEEECTDVHVGSWVVDDVEGPWCGERYTQKRDVKYKVKRKTHLYIGPPVANVMQAHYCRVEGNDKCVVKMRVEFDGIPYSDTFAVEIRWVARRKGDRDVTIDVGVDLDFKKNTFLKSKIRSGTIEETTLVHRSLFGAVKKTCATASGAELLEEGIEVELAKKEDLAVPSYEERLLAVWNSNFYVIVGCGCLLLFVWRILFLRSGQRGRIASTDVPYNDELTDLSLRMDSLDREIKEVKEVLNEILTLLKDRK